MFSVRLRELRKKNKMTQRQLAEKLFVDCSSVTKWETGKAFPDFSNQKKLANIFNVSLDYLLGNEPPKTDYDLFPSEDITYMEVIGSVKAGYGGSAQEEHTGETVAIPTVFFKGNNRNDFFLLRVSGSSMYPKMLDGDLVLVEKKTSVDSGSVAVVMYDAEEATIKTVKYVSGEDWLDLIPANPEYETKHIEGHDLEKCRILGKVVKLIRDL